MSARRKARGRGGGWEGRITGGGRGTKEFNTSSTSASRSRVNDKPRTLSSLSQSLIACQGAPYPVYKDFKGQWDFGRFHISLDRVQADPYASPSQIRISVPHQSACFPLALRNNQSRITALADYIHRQLYRVCSTREFDVKESHSGWAGAKGGDITMDLPCSQVLQRTAVLVTSETVEARLRVALPAKGRSIQGKRASEVLTQNLVAIVEQSMLFDALDGKALLEHVQCVEDQESLRAQLPAKSLVAFIPNGAILPRQSGISSRPMTGKDVTAFQSPSSLQVQFNLPNRTVQGIGLPARALIVCLGAGLHGKSTLLDAIALGCYNHIPGDGREFVSSVDDVVSVSSEDGRAVNAVDISNFITDLPNGKSTRNFSTPDASGSTSCSASFSEAVELGSRLICIDEDSTATNWLASSPIMDELINKHTITPLEKRAKDLIKITGSSILLVCGSSGSFLKDAQPVLRLENYSISDVTTQAKQLAQQHGLSDPEQRDISPVQMPTTRKVLTPSLKAVGKVVTRNRHTIDYGGERGDESSQLDLRAVPQIVTESQTRAIANALKNFGASQSSYLPLKAAIEQFDKSLSPQLEALQQWPEPDGTLARPRAIDIAAAINRMRAVEISPDPVA